MKIMTLWGEEEVHNTRMCIHCKQVKHEEEFGIRSYTKNGVKSERRNDCNSCRKKETKISGTPAVKLNTYLKQAVYLNKMVKKKD